MFIAQDVSIVHSSDSLDVAIFLLDFLSSPNPIVLFPNHNDMTCSLHVSLKQRTSEALAGGVYFATVLEFLQNTLIRAFVFNLIIKLCSVLLMV